MNYKKTSIIIIILLLIAAAITIFFIKMVPGRGEIPAGFYKTIEGKWYTQASSGGYNVKFTRNEVQYYDRQTDQLVYSGRIKKVIKISSGQYKDRYRIVFKNAGGTASFINEDEKANGFSYFSGEEGYEGYSGSSSINIVKE